MNREPVVILNALGVLLLAVFAFLIEGGFLSVTPEQQDLVKTLIGGLIALIVTVVSRSMVTPVNK